MLAHKASAEGIAAVERIAGLVGEVDYDAIPAVVYTSPEVASVGKTEEELKNLGVRLQIGGLSVFRDRAGAVPGRDGRICQNPRALGSGRILGVHIIGPRASELIAECVIAVQSHMSAEDLSRTVHAHPTLSEAVHESAAMLPER